MLSTYNVCRGESLSTNPNKQVRFLNLVCRFRRRQISITRFCLGKGQPCCFFRLSISAPDKHFIHKPMDPGQTNHSFFRSDCFHLQTLVTWYRHEMFFSALLALSAGNTQVRGAMMFSLICVWINSWIHKQDAGDLRRYRAHFDVTVMRSSVN